MFIRVLTKGHNLYIITLVALNHEVPDQILNETVVSNRSMLQPIFNHRESNNEIVWLVSIPEIESRNHWVIDDQPKSFVRKGCWMRINSTDLWIVETVCYKNFRGTLVFGDGKSVRVISCGSFRVLGKVGCELEKKRRNVSWVFWNAE